MGLGTAVPFGQTNPGGQAPEPYKEGDDDEYMQENQRKPTIFVKTSRSMILTLGDVEAASQKNPGEQG